jgi:hypothetical protein
MTIDRDNGGDAGGLEALLQSARLADQPKDDLLARVLADADRVQAGFAATTPSPQAPPQRAGPRGWLSGVMAAMGGWPAVSGVTLAGVTGLVVGFAAPDLVDGWSGGQIWTWSGGGGSVPEIGALWDAALNDAWNTVGGLGDV